MTKRFDLIVIGTGTAASAAALRCRAAGWTVAVIDSRPFGGTCSLRGCDPKKVLVGAAEAIDWTRRLRGKGVQADDARIDWPQLIAFKRSIIASVPKSREEGFARNGIGALHGRAKFTGHRPSPWAATRWKVVISSSLLAPSQRIFRFLAPSTS